MPELPEVETTRRGISPHISQQRVTDIIIRQRQLRWPIPKLLSTELNGQVIEAVSRRGKYLLLHSKPGTAILHLGMSGRLHILPKQTAVQKHDHVDIVFANDQCLRFNDPRRFGCLLWTNTDVYQHPRLRHLGPEPLTDAFSADYLYQCSRHKQQSVKTWIMNSRTVVGVGNIYANEALFLAGIQPQRAAYKISRARYQRLYQAIVQVLQQAIDKGGSSLRDFLNSDGKPGYFQQCHQVYGRGGQACLRCHKSLKEIRLGQRSTVYCTNCQT